MADTIRALCAELVRCWDAFIMLKSHTCWDDPPSTDSVDDAVEKIRTALAQQEAEGPTDDQLTLTYAYAVADAVGNKRGLFKIKDAEAAQLAGLRAVLARWGRPAPALAQPEVKGPTDEEVLKLAKHHSIAYTLIDGSVIHPLQEDTDIREEVLAFARDLRARWGRPGPAPIPVAERLPREEEDGPWCWAGKEVDNVWEWTQLSTFRFDSLHQSYTHWLPHWALPLPAGTKED